MRRTPLLIPAALVFVLAACGGGPGATDGGNGGNGDESAAASVAASEAEPSTNGGGNGGGPSEGDLEQLAQDLTPPNSTETSRTTAGGVIFVTYESTDSPEDLQAFYEDAIGRTGLEVFSRTSAGGAYSWIFAENDTSSYGGVVSVGPSGTGSGSAVVVQVGSGE